jgi:hypothetical protein
LAVLFNILGWLLQIAWVASFLYGVACAFLTWQHRLPPRHRHQKIFPIDEQLDPEGRLYLRKAGKAFAVAIGVILLATIVL